MTSPHPSRIIEEMAERMREDAATGMPDRILKQVNFRALATSAYEVIRYHTLVRHDGEPVRDTKGGVRIRSE